MMLSSFKKRRRKTGTVRGSIDGIIGGRIFGWIIAAESSVPLLDVYVDGSRIESSIKAEHDRQDLMEQRTGGAAFYTSVCRFSSEQSVHVEITYAGQSAVLLERQIEVNRESCWGAIDGISEGRLVGWIASVDTGEPIVASFYVNEELAFSEHKACVARPDLFAFGLECHGFSIPVPDLSNIHNARIKIVPKNAPEGGIETVLAGAGELAGAKTEAEQKESVPTNGHMKRLAADAGDRSGQPGVPLDSLFAAQGMRRNNYLANTIATALDGRGAAKSSSVTDVRLRLEEVNSLTVRGWVVDPASREKVLDVYLYVDGTLFASRKANDNRPDLKKHGITTGLGGFGFKFPASAFGESELAIEVVVEGTHSKTQRIQVEQRRAPEPYALRSGDAPRVAIVIPVYNAADEFSECLDRLFRYTSKPVRLIVVNDASTDPRIQEILDPIREHSYVEVLDNEDNKGFTASVNKGMDAAPNEDIVLLNSDARVTPGWLDGLRAAIDADQRNATATPLSDKAGAFSAPKIGNENRKGPGVSEAVFARAVGRRAKRLYPATPTGNGFCMYIRREALHELGTFDVEAFPRGYGEENDFCMKARRNGWFHVVDDCSYVFHSRAKSFGEEKGELLTAGRQKLDQRYPEYTKEVKDFAESLTMALARYRVTGAEQNAVALGWRSRVLYVVATSTGGTPQTNADLMASLSAGWETWLLHFDSWRLRLSWVSGGQSRVIEEHELLEPVEPIRHRSAEYERVVSSWLQHYCFEVVHIRHLAWHSLKLPELAWAARAAVVNSFHDFYTLCPTVQLVDEQNKFCGGQCTLTSGECEPKLWDKTSLPSLKNAWVYQWRNQFEKALQYCDAHVTTSIFAQKRILHAMATLRGIPFNVVPHGRDFTEFRRTFEVPEERVRVLIPGNINRSKGSHLLAEIHEEDVEQRFEFYILGATDFDFSQYRRIFEAGSYTRDSFIKKVNEIKPHVAAILSIWDETWCHTLTESWAAGLPVFALDFPTVGERIRSTGAGWICSYTTGPEIYHSLAECCETDGNLFEVLGNVSEWQRTSGIGNTTRLMAAQYEDVYRQAMTARDLRETPFCEHAPVDAGRPTVAVVCPANSNLRKANASTHIRIWERTHNSSSRPLKFVRMTGDQLVGAAKAGLIEKAIIQRNALSATQVRYLTQNSSPVRYVVDLDDNLFDVPVKKDMENYGDNAPHLKSLMAAADAVTVSTRMLKDLTQNHNANVLELPNRLSERLWAGWAPTRQKSHEVRALYFGTPTHDEDLALVKSACEALVEKYPRFELRIIGDSGKELFSDCNWVKFVDPPQETKDYPEFVRFAHEQARGCDFGIVPLVDGGFNEYKSPLKLLEMAGLGLPCLVSDVNVYRPVAQNAPHAWLVANEPDCWFTGLEALCQRAPFDYHVRCEAKQWSLDTYGLDCSLADFDQLISETLV